MGSGEVNKYPCLGHHCWFLGRDVIDELKDAKPIDSVTQHYSLLGRQYDVPADVYTWTDDEAGDFYIVIGELWREPITWIFDTDHKHLIGMVGNDDNL